MIDSIFLLKWTSCPQCHLLAIAGIGEGSGSEANLTKDFKLLTHSQGKLLPKYYFRHQV